MAREKKDDDSLFYERRRYPRVPVMIMFDNLFDTEKLMYIGRGFLRDISAGGVCFEVRDNIRLGARLALSLELPSGSTLKHIRAEVVRSKKESSIYAIGCIFNKLGFFNGMKLRMFLRKDLKIQLDSVKK